MPGEDNGMNTWLDAQLNQSLNTDEEIQVTYAKRNSDRNRYHDIDDVPMRGPSAIQQTELT